MLGVRLKLIVEISKLELMFSGCILFWIKKNGSGNFKRSKNKYFKNKAQK